jgi:hypothetical protein
VPSTWGNWADRVNPSRARASATRATAMRRSVLASSLADERLERLVLEELPPRQVGQGARTVRALGHGSPARGGRDGRTLVVRAEGAPPRVHPAVTSAASPTRAARSHRGRAARPEPEEPCR